MNEPAELSPEKCEELLRASIVGRVAFGTADGPRITPVNYVTAGDAVVFRTAPESELGRHAGGSRLAFEIDHFDYETHTGWSVMVQGRAEVVTDPAEVRRLKQVWAPRPWAEGSRNLYVRIPWTELSGRSLGGNLSTPVRRVVTAS